MGAKNAAILKDEIYFQLIKQIRANIIEESQNQCWILFGSIATFWSPSHECTWPILQWLKFISTHHHKDEIQVWAKFSFARILKNYQDSQRVVLPSTYELEFVRDHRRIPFTVYFYSGGSMDLNMENYWKIADLKEEIMSRLGMDPSLKSFYSFVEQTRKPNKIEETYVEDFVFVCDLVASWEHESVFYKQALGGTGFQATFKLLFKMKYDSVKSLGDENHKLNILYNEACYFFQNLHLPMNYDNLVKLTALNFQIDYGDADSEKYDYLKTKLLENPNFFIAKIPCFKVKFEKPVESEDDKPEPREASEVVENVLEEYQKLSGKKRNECKVEFNKVVDEYDMKGYSLYVVKLLEKINATEDLTKTRKGYLIVGFRPAGMTFFNDNYEILLQLEYGEVFKWGYAEKTLV